MPEGEDEVSSRYTIVLAAAKRARQLIDGAEPVTLNYKVDKPVSIAVQEMYENKLHIKQNVPKEENDKTEDEKSMAETFGETQD